jgi:phospholipid/cholesterol/gamma-HCH transport system ATP-binding protein
METLTVKIPAAATMENQKPVIEVRHLYKAFGENQVLRNFSLEVRPGENTVVMGKSGSGKTVLIKCIIGLLKPDRGYLSVLGKDISTLNHHELDALRTRIGYVFQSSALYDSMTVKENLEFPLRRGRHQKINADTDTLIHEALRDVGLEHAIHLMPSELSGGMRKRIGIARSLILKPEIVLYDEPTTGLDPITSREIIDLILKVQRKYHTASIIITHDMELARIASNKIVFLLDGRAYMEGAYEELSRTEDPRIKPFFTQESL